MWLFVAMFLLAGGGLLWMGWRIEAAARRAEAWPRVAGTLESCEVVERPALGDDEASTWDLVLCYSYVVGGRTYRSHRYAFGFGGGTDDAPVRRVAAELQSRAELVVRYD